MTTTPAGPLFSPPEPPARRGDGVAATVAQEAAESVRRSGWAAKTLKTTYAVVHEHGPATRDEIDHFCHERDGRKPGRGQSTYVRRLYELLSAGLITESTMRRQCPILGKRVTAYQITGQRLPADRPAKVAGEDLRQRIEDLEETLDARNMMLDNWSIGVARMAAEIRDIAAALSSSDDARLRLRIAARLEDIADRTALLPSGRAEPGAG